MLPSPVKLLNSKPECSAARSGWIGLGLILLALAHEVIYQLLWQPTFPQVAPWEPYTDFLPSALIIGLLLILRSIILSIHERRAARIPKVSFTAIGPLGPEWRPLVSRAGSFSSHPPENGERPPRRLMFSPISTLPLLLRKGAIVILLVTAITWPDEDQLGVVFVAGLLAIIVWRVTTYAEGLRIQPESGAISLVHHRLRPHVREPLPDILPSHGLGTWGYPLVLVPLMLCIVFLLVFQYPQWGFYVRLPSDRQLSAMHESWNDPLVVRVSHYNLWYLNQRPVSRAELAPRLESLLSVRGDRTVFVDADEINRAGWTIEAAAEIMNAPDAKVALVTPAMKKEFAKLDGRSPCENIAPGVETLNLPHLNNKIYHFHYYALFSFALEERV